MAATPRGSIPNREKADKAFQKQFTENEFGHACSVCDRLWFVNDLKPITEDGGKVLVEKGHFESAAGFNVCQTCRTSLRAGKIPKLSTSNGFTYPEKPTHLPPLDPITERLISPRLPFMQIRRLCHARGSYSIIGQVINIPVDVEEMVRVLPRQLDDDYAFNVCIKKHLIHKSNYLSGFVKKSVVKAWLRFLIDTPLYKREGIVLDESLLSDFTGDDELIQMEVTETGDDTSRNGEPIQLDVIENEAELFACQQQTILWSEDKSLNIAPGQNRIPSSIVYDQYAEELSFPDIYLGQLRKYRPDVHVTAYDRATSEARRRDRRGATPRKLLYTGPKIFRLRVHDGLQSSFKFAGTVNVTRAQISDKNFVDGLIEKSLAFMKSIPNSALYWQQRKRDVLAMVRQLGKPSVFLTMSISEMTNPNLLKVLYKLSGVPDKIDLTDPMQQLSALQRSTLASDDPVTCCLYFNKLVDVIFNILCSRSKSPFGKYYVKDYFKRIEFQNRGSPHVHAILWLANDPQEDLSEHMPATMELINTITSINIEDLPPETAGKQVHSHTTTCTKRGEKRCRFNIPYWPMKEQRMLIPLKADDHRRKELKKRAEEMRTVLEEMRFDSNDDFLAHCECTYEYYIDVVRASLKQPTVFYKRSTDEKELRTNPFNPWIAEKLLSSMDLQFILDVAGLCCYLVEYVNKTNRGMSALHRELILLQEQFPEMDHGEMLKKVALKTLGSVEMCAQEAAWFLLRLPMSEASKKVEFIPTMWPQDRTRSRKRFKQMDEEGIDDDSTAVWTKNIIQKYEERDGLDDVCLADFVALYTPDRGTNSYKRRRQAKILRWRGYRMSELSEYKRESVLLFLPFRNELIDILDGNKFLQLYDLHEAELLAKRKEYDCELNIEQTVEEYERTLINMEEGVQEKAATEKRNEFDHILQPNNDDFDMLPTSALRSIVKQRTNVMPKEQYCAMVRQTNAEQRDLILQVIHLLHCKDREPLQIFLTGPAGSGKTFTLRALMETYNRFSQVHNTRNNAYVASASTGKAASDIGGNTTHHNYHIALSRQTSKLSFETLQMYRTEMQSVLVHFIDEISMIGAKLLHIIDERIRDIYSNHEEPFGGVDMILCGDLYQLPPVNARSVFKPPANSLAGAVLWQSLHYHPLKQVMRQADKPFSDILTKIGGGEKLTADETKMIESRFRTADWCKTNAKGAIRLFHRNADVTAYNQEALSELEGLDCTADDVITGFKNAAQRAGAQTKLHKMSVVETSGLPYMIRLCLGMPYLVTTNVDVSDGIVNGAIGDLMHVEECEDDGEQRITRLWMKFSNEKIGTIARIKAEPLFRSRPDILRRDWTPIDKRSANINLGNSIKCKRIQFPVVPACGLTIHKSQGGTFDEIVFDYDKGQEQQMVYVGLSRVKSLQGLYITNSKNDFKFHHAKGCTTPKMQDLRNEMKRLERHNLRTIANEVSEIIESSGPASTLMTINVQSFNAHKLDISTDRILSSVNYLALSETWIDNHSHVELDGYTCIVQSKRPGTRAGGVAILQKMTTNPNTTSTTLATPHMLELVGEERDEEFSKAEKYGDICAAKITVMGTEVLLVSVYISPGTTITQKGWFLARTLIQTAKLDMPMVVTGDFNIDVSRQENGKFIEFMYEHFKLCLATNVKEPTTLGGTVLDLTFTKNVTAEVTRFISYFSYHRPMLAILRPTALEPSQSD